MMGQMDWAISCSYRFIGACGAWITNFLQYYHLKKMISVDMFLLILAIQA